jgi:hypothetical protein
LGDFTATDRRRIVEKLLGDDYVLEALHHVIFSVPEQAPGAPPSRGSGDGSRGGMGSVEQGTFGFMQSVPGVAPLPEDEDDDYGERQRTGWNTLAWLGDLAAW